MREIKFRGKRKDNGKWVYGYYVKSPMGFHYIYIGKEGKPIWDIERCYIRVIPETVGQYTGLKDQNGKNGKEIYEGDILEYHLVGPGYTDLKRRTIVFKDGAFGPRVHPTLRPEVIGNIHDNPELLEKP